MANQTLGLDSNLYQYFQQVSIREAEILKALREETQKYPMARMQIAPEQGQLMALLVQLMKAKKTLDIGVFTGYSALVVALALPFDGQVIACDVDEEITKIAQQFWEKAGVRHKIDFHLAPALETLDQLIAKGENNTFDFAFIDADKSNYNNYYEKVLWLVKPGGLIAIDNVLWGGKVANSDIQDNRTKKIRAFNEKLHQDPRISLSLIPIADGVTLALKK
ncbi:O-methyltransferase, family 3 [Crocosphaera subtropica ATCC 51142]|uniref:O-methyltransferase, family 3 n=1 Tax=Crocosphaera subtropica (strain ATCC 51142 / BH68) TaxID=43989 RepID=B1WWA4_CROS5|nr:class I SAM-dependent methyltransferase [Crocosphaera subtropica]ACB54032.1 O-methyltransferase, family 3 [Crocosphaera subtropica ATCC 51142]